MNEKFSYFRDSSKGISPFWFGYDNPVNTAL